MVTGDSAEQRGREPQQAKMPTFRIPARSSAKATTAERLIYELPMRQVQHLWAHQADLLKQYDADHEKSADIALELPTGAGKTLVGLILGEFRRRKNGERVTYLCPTRQLVHQVAEQAKTYDIRALACLQPDYQGLSEYLRGDAIAVTTYSSLFNVNPRIRDPQVIILDDAHAGEDFIARHWSVQVTRKDSEQLLEQLFDILKPAMSAGAYARVRRDSEGPFSRQKVDIATLPMYWNFIEGFREALNVGLSNGNDRARFAWSVVRDHLHACVLYFNWHEMIIRPVIPPTLTHPAFANATQRIYMSATLGERGDLERISGVRSIRRLRLPESWRSHGTGRRLFLFPGLTTDDKDGREIEIAAITRAERAIVLTPRESEAAAIRDALRGRGVQPLDARAVEESLQTFTSIQKAALVLANRYDGIDLPGDQCRVVVLDGLPAGTNLQEQFLLTRVGADVLLTERIRTRFVQGAGRCCRSASDYAVVLVVGQGLTDFCMKRESRASMHPEIQAELEFAIENSDGRSSEDLLGLMEVFLARDDQWREADQAIVQLREQKTVVADSSAGQALRTVGREVDFVYSMWRRDYRRALEDSLAVADQLSGGRDTDAYRGWWYYQAGTAAWLGATEFRDPELRARAADLFRRATRCVRVATWLAELAESGGESPPAASNDWLSSAACENAFMMLERLGFTGVRFTERTREMLDALNNDHAPAFEAGLQKLGEFLGFVAAKPTGSAKPDGVWRIADQLAFAFEAKSDEKSDGPISVATVRQARTHEKCVRDEERLTNGAKVATVVISPRTWIDPEAKRHAEGLFFFSRTALRALADDVVAVLSRIRAQSVESAPNVVLELMRREFLEARLLLPDLQRRFTAQTLVNLPTSGGSTSKRQKTPGT